LTITWIGHGTVLLEMDGVRLVTDPLLRPRLGHVRRVAPPPTEIPGEVDAVLVSHVHYDHLDLRSLRLVRPRRLIVPRGARRFLRRRGLTDVDELDEGGEISIGTVSVVATHAHHVVRRGRLARSTPALGFLISGSARLYFAGDTDLFAAMQGLGRNLDVAFLPIWGWGPRIGAGHLDPHRAAEALLLLRPRIAIPIHWGTYTRIGLSRDAATLREPAEQFARVAAEVAPDVAVCILSPGERFVVPSTPSLPRPGGE
jgi:L-ascorbate metabolism protein UlaG (beta-lactamase superfamily)